MKKWFTSVIRGKFDPKGYNLKLISKTFRLLGDRKEKSRLGKLFCKNNSFLKD